MYGKGKVVPVRNNQALRHEDIWESEGMAPPFLISGLDGGEWLASSPGRFTRGKNHRYPLDRRMGGPQSRSGRRGEQKILAPTGTRTPTPLPSSP
jgi:hypothetical protein